MSPEIQMLGTVFVALLLVALFGLCWRIERIERALKDVGVMHEDD